MYCKILSSEAKKEREREMKRDIMILTSGVWKKRKKKRRGIACFLLITWLPGGGEEMGGGGWGGGGKSVSFSITMGFSSVLGYRKGGRGSEFYDNLVVAFSCTTLCIIQVQGLVGGGKKRRKKSPSLLLISMLYPYQMDRAGRGC